MFRPEARLRQKPFTPLRILASEGLQYEIHHADLVLVGQRDLTIGFPSPGNSAIYNRQIRVALVHIEGLEDIPVKSSSSNGDG